MKLPIDHLIVVHEEVELPDECPNCGAALTITEHGVGALEQEDRRLKVWEFQDQARYAKVLQFKGGEQEIDWDCGLPEGGESFRYCAWHCSECDHPLVVHGEHMLDKGDDAVVDGILGLASD